MLGRYLMWKAQGSQAAHAYHLTPPLLCTSDQEDLIRASEASKRTILKSDLHFKRFCKFLFYQLFKRRRSRRSLRLDHHARQMLLSKLSVKTNPQSEPLSSLISCSTTTQNMCSSPRTRNNLGYRNSSTSLQQQDGPLPGAFLPIELLLLIFHFGADLCDELPVAVSQTCRLWRWISIRSAALWCHIKPDRRRLLCVRRIQRSRNHPLYIEIAPPSPPVKCFSLLCHVYTLMASVLPVAERWRSLSIRFDDYVPFLWNSALSGLCTSSECHAVKSLESLSLIYPMNDDTKEFHLFADNAPKLKRVVVWGIRLRWTKSLFSNLEYLDYTHHGFNSGHEAVQEILRMLSISCPKLKKLSITFFQSRIISGEGAHS
ncbi:hypothetical protein PNOK_0694500 [Pyrrhoderma noxium]|uniref:F-box domain-containing protein n=1 Tax=Pyrrhoderma noxium TaxID=2282107 RepID=A0A286UBB0_9AGAM|nr:hypothetical protein PNOK_0694500 [Pyrrhoderma noxium]